MSHNTVSHHTLHQSISSELCCCGFNTISEDFNEGKSSPNSVPLWCPTAPLLPIIDSKEVVGIKFYLEAVEAGIVAHDQLLVVLQGVDVAIGH